jgi:hypothetical protein
VPVPYEKILTQYFFAKLSELCGLYPGLEIREKHIPDPDPGIKKAPDPGSATLLEYTGFLALSK